MKRLWRVEWINPETGGREIYQQKLSRRRADKLAYDLRLVLSPKWFGVNAMTFVVPDDPAARGAADYVDPSGKWVKEYAIAPRYTPLWALAKRGPDLVLPTHVEGKNFVEVQLTQDEDDSDNLTDRRREHLLSPISMKRAYRKSSGSDWISQVLIQHEGSPVGWYDLDDGFVRYATLWDLAHLKQGVPQDSTDPELARFAGRPLWLLSEKQWDEAEFPPPIRHGPPFAKGVTVAAETGRMREMREAMPHDEISLWRQTGRQDAANVIDVNEIEEALGARPSKAAIKKWLLTEGFFDEDQHDFPEGATKAERKALADAWADGWSSYAERVMASRGAREGKADDYPDMEAALLGAQSRHDATHAVRGTTNATIFSPSSKGYVKRVGFREKGFYHWPEKGELVGDLPRNAEMIHRLVDTGWDPEAAPTMPVSTRRAAENSRGSIKEIPAGHLKIGDAIVADNGEIWKVVEVVLTGAKTMRAAFVTPSDARIDLKLRRRAIFRKVQQEIEEPRENPVDVSNALPWVKVSRDPERYQAALKDAKAIGPIDDPKKVYELLGPALLKEDQETFIVVLLDVRQQCRGVAEVHRGSRSRVSTSLVDVLRVVIASGAEGFCVCHNHPSGKASPSSADKDLTKSIADAAKLFDGDLTFVDHVIIGNREFYSFADRRLHKIKK